MWRIVIVPLPFVVRSSATGKRKADSVSGSALDQEVTRAQRQRHDHDNDNDHDRQDRRLTRVVEHDHDVVYRYVDVCRRGVALRGCSCSAK